MSDPSSKLARRASVDDLKPLLRARHDHDVDTLLIGGYARYALGYERGTVDIDLVLRPTRDSRIAAPLRRHDRTRWGTGPRAQPGGSAEDQAERARPGQTGP